MVPPTCPIVLDPAGTDIQAEARRVRDAGTAPVVELPGAVEARLVTDYSRIREVASDPRVSKDARKHWPRYIDGEIADDWPLHLWVSVNNMFTAYGDDHKRLRRLIAGAFTARRTEAMRPRVQKIADGLLDELAAVPYGEVVDLREAYAVALPACVISDLIGLPESARPAIRRVVDSVFHTAASPEEVQATTIAGYTLLHELVAQKRAEPGDDMASDLIAARDEDGSRLSEQELVDTLFLMLAAGHETTVNLIDQATYALLSHPEQLALIRGGEESWQAAVEEALRWQAPVANLPMRYAVEDIVVGDTLIKKGEAIVLGLAAAGRDPEQHGSDADRFDITRVTRDRHLSFGYGAHHCLGAPLARVEGVIALESLFTRFPDMALAVEGPPAHLASFIANGHDSLPVRLHRG
ncbi:cytochrome P450 family protein [Sinosporangium siamense]|uniref:Cytochrome P450 n=1 Tax=Sinosporangium siamense TaxID=1367973 RepID=A0A919RPE1_9ACTN|nr:cytochrome P450 [Sinosporangium siamense]GII97298.1 cytochrome P450 [Sinosporangium siamense]